MITVPPERVLGWYSQLFHVFPKDKWDLWLSHERKRASPRYPATWYFLLFGNQQIVSTEMRGPLSECLDLLLQDSAYRFLCAWQDELSLRRTLRFDNGAQSFTRYMRGYWHFDLQLISHDEATDWWCTIIFQSKRRDFRAKLWIWDAQHSDESLLTAFLDILIGVWSSQDFPLKTRENARDLLCNLADHMVTLLTKWVPKPIVV